MAAGIDLLVTLPADTSQVVAVGHSAGGHLAAWAAGRSALPAGTPGARRPQSVDLTGVVAQAGVLLLADCAREGVGGTAATDLMGGGPDSRPREYRLAELDGDHFTLIDPAAPDWAAVIAALPALLRGSLP